MKGGAKVLCNNCSSPMSLKQYKSKFQQGFDHFEFGDHNKLKKKITSKTAAIMVETIMGEGGIKVIPTWFKFLEANNDSN